MPEGRRGLARAGAMARRGMRRATRLLFTDKGPRASLLAELVSLLQRLKDARPSLWTAGNHCSLLASAGIVNSRGGGGGGSLSYKYTP